MLQTHAPCCPGSFDPAAGDPDALARIRVQDAQHLKHVVNQLRRANHVTGTKTLMVLDSWSRPT